MLARVSPPDSVSPNCAETVPRHMLTFSHMGIYTPTVFKVRAREAHVGRLHALPPPSPGE